MMTFRALTFSWRRSLSYRNQSIDLHSKSIDWFLYDGDLCHERVKRFAMMKFQEMKRQMTEITSGKTKPSEINPASRNNITFLHTKLGGKPSYAKQSTLKKDNERKKWIDDHRR